jgi:putative SOS response-associated peptidase YedK
MRLGDGRGEPDWRESKFWLLQLRCRESSMCNLYSLTKGQSAIIALVRAMRDRTGNLPPLPGVFPDYFAPIAHNGPDGVRELAMARWGMPGPPAFGGAPITNIRNVKSPHWRA